MGLAPTTRRWLWPRIGWLGLIVLLGVAIWFPRHRRLGMARQGLVDLRTQQTAAAERAAVARREADSLEAQLRASQAEQDRALTAIAQSERELARVDPDGFWAEPPAGLPHWDTECPFVWLPKEILPDLPVEAFTKAGELRPEVGVVLTIDASQQRQLNEAVQRLLSDYREAETARIRRVDDHLPGIAGQEGVKLTLEVPPLPEESARFKQAFGETLQTVLGERRGDLLNRIASGWLDSQLSLDFAGSRPKVFSVVRRPDGGFGLSIKTGWHWLSTVIPAGGPVGLDEYIPAHVLPWFEADFIEVDPHPEP